MPKIYTSAVKYSDAPCPRCGTPEKVVNPRWLRQRRVGAGVSLRQLADKLSYSAAFLCDVEYGRRTCKPELLASYEKLGR